MIEPILKKALKWTLIPCALAAVVFLFLNRRVSWGILLGFFGAVVYSLFLSSHARKVDDAVNYGTAVPKDSYVRISILGITLFLTAIMPDIFHWAGTFGALVIFRISLFVIGKSDQ